jgi:tetratricopeptide (TPR) repeat protein
LCDFVVERNSEWNFNSIARQYLQEQLMKRRDLMQATHARLLKLASSPDAQVRVGEIPLYLTTGPGKAYHSAFINLEAGLAEYSLIALTKLSGQQWLATKLAREQQDFDIMPQDVLELDFLQGMVYYREGKISQAITLLRKVADTPSDRLEVAIAAHLVGRFDGRHHQTRRAEALLDRSLKINEALENQFGEAQVLQTLGQLIGRDRKRAAEAEGLLRRSLAIGESLDADWHVAQVLHTLGQLIGRDRERVAEADELLQRSLSTGQAHGNKLHQAQVLYTLGYLRSVSDRDEAVELLQRSLALNQELHDHKGIAIVQKELRRLGEPWSGE